MFSLLCASPEPTKPHYIHVICRTSATFYEGYSIPGAPKVLQLRYNFFFTKCGTIKFKRFVFYIVSFAMAHFWPIQPAGERQVLNVSLGQIAHRFKVLWF